jgi:acetyl esterase/lipase
MAEARFPVSDADALVRFRRRSERLADIVFSLPHGVTQEASSIGGVAGDWLTPPDASDGPVIVFLHGGGIIFGWRNANRRILAYIAKFSGLRAFGVDYRLAPEYRYPAAHDDCSTVYRTLVEQGRQVVLIGESSGGVLALATLLRAKEQGLPQPRLCAFISPTVDYRFQDPRIWNSHDAFGDPHFAVDLHMHYIAGHDTRSPDLSPVDADLTGLAPMWVLAAEHDILRGEAERLAEAAKQHAVTLELVLWPGVWHAWHGFVPFVPEATQALKMLGSVVREHAGLWVQQQAEACQSPHRCRQLRRLQSNRESR